MEDNIYSELNQIRVYWEDTLDNYSKTNEKRIEKYFQGKYKTPKVKVVFKAISNKKSDISTDLRADASELILDPGYQRNLIDKFIEDNAITINRAHFDKLDTTVSASLEDYKDQTNRYKSYKILKLEFSNFLSYGENNVVELGEPGITSISSHPGNFAGKSVLSIDLLLFLFYGVTSKSTKFEDIFNKYTDNDLVSVKGTIEIEGELYIIKRVLSRKLGKNKEYKCSSELNFYRPLPKGGVKELNGDEKRVTEELIKNYVGTYDDCLITILTTADNLEDLIKTKPTERGRLLTRFIGLEFYREKEKIAKKMYSEWREKSNLSRTNTADVLSKIEVEKSRINGNIQLNQNNNLNLKLVEEKLNDNLSLKELLQSKRINNVDTELYKLNEDTIVSGINKLNESIKDKELILKNLIELSKEPAQPFDIDRYQILTSNLREKEKDLLNTTFQISSNNANIKSLTDDEFCRSCKQPLKDVDNKPKILEIQNSNILLNESILSLNKEINIIKDEISKFDTIKSEWDEFNKNELILSRHRIDLLTHKESLKRGEDKLKQYRDNIANIESNKKIDTDLELIKTKLTNIYSERDLLLLQIKSTEKDIESSHKLIDGFNSLIKELNKDESIDKIFKTYLDVYGKNGISKMILGTMIPLINSYLHALLVDTSEFILELRMEDGGDVNFWMVDKETGVEKNIAAGSGYEKTVSSLALRAVFSKVSSLPKPNLIVFDEITGKVANENLDKLGLFFDKLKTYFDHIWLITHNPLVQDWADNSIKILKENNISKLLN